MCYFVIQGFLLTSLLCQLLTARTTLGSIIATANNPAWKSFGAADIEHSLITDVLLGSKHTKDMNYLFIGVGLDVPCEITKCEKYSIHELKQTLEKRGWIRNVRQDPNFYYFGPIRNINAGSSRKDVVFLKFVDIDFTDLDTLNLIRKYNRKCYLVILVDDVDTFQRLKTYLLETQMYNVFVISKGIHPGIYILYEICAFCKEGVTELKVYNIWRLGNGFLKEMRYQQSFKGQFFGATLGIGMKLSPPGVLVTGKNSDGSPIYSGSDYWLLFELAKRLNFKPAIEQPKDGYSCWNSDDKPAGFCIMLLDNSVAMAGLPYTITYFVFHWFDPTAVYYTSGNVIVSARPAASTHLSSMLSSSDPTVLTLIFVSFAVSVIVYFCISQYWTTEYEISLVETLLLFFTVLCLEAIKVHGLKGYQRFIILIWMLVCFFVISAVLGEITSIAATPGLKGKPINSVEEMIERKVSWVVPPGLYADAYLLLRNDVSEIKKKKKSLMFFEGLQYVLNNPTEYIYYFAKEGVKPLIRMYFWDGKGNSPFHFSPLVDNDQRYMVSILVNKASPFREAIAQKLLQLEAGGLYMHKMMPDVLEVFGRISVAQSKKEDESFTPLSLDNMLFTLVVLAVGSIMSVLVFTYEKSKLAIVSRI